MVTAGQELSETLAVPAISLFPALLPICPVRKFGEIENRGDKLRASGVRRPPLDSSTIISLVPRTTNPPLDGYEVHC